MMIMKLRRGLLFKPKGCDKGGTFYTVILKKRWLFPGWCKTANIYECNEKEDCSKLECEIKKFDSRDYLKDVNTGILELLNEEEKIELDKMIKDLPKKVQNEIYRRGKISIFPYNQNNKYAFEIQNVFKLDNLLEERSSEYN